MPIKWPLHWCLKRPGKNRQEPCVNDGARVYAIGDVHGRADLLEHLHLSIEDDLRRHPAQGPVELVHLGDYVDRGDDSRGVLERLCAAPPTGVDQMINLRGNHEDLFGRFLDDANEGRHWMQLGGDATVASYGIGISHDVPPGDRFQAIHTRLLETMPQTHRDLLDSLKYSHRNGDYLFVHAGLRPGRKWEQQRPEDLMWIRDLFLKSNANHGAMVVHGHHCTEAPDICLNRIGIDTGAYYSHKLTCLVLEGSQQRYLQTGPGQTDAEKTEHRQKGCNA